MQGQRGCLIYTALDSAAGSWHTEGLFILPPRARHAARTCTLHPVARTREPEPCAAARRFLPERFPPAHTRTRRTGRASPFQPNEVAPRTSEPDRRPEPAEMRERIPTTRPNPSHSHRTGRTARPNARNARPNPSRPTPSGPTTVIHPPEPAPRRRTRVPPRARPNPSARPHAPARPAATLPPAGHRRPSPGIPRPVRRRGARASVRVLPLFPQPPACLKTTASPSTPPFRPAFVDRVANLVLNQVTDIDRVVFENGVCSPRRIQGPSSTPQWT